MITKLLIANRGEIACRIIRTARAMGIATVAVYSDADARALHVRQADEAVPIGPALAAQSYLVGAKIIAAARQTGADAIHPGYGFLSENADFAQTVIDAGLIWVGPRPESIRAMGLKDAARKMMRAAGVPVTPGYDGADQSVERLTAEAEAIGYPVLIKAVAGGGGKGMRRVERPTDFLSALESCRREAEASFGNPQVLLEKWITAPRHIEVQVFGDAHGNIIHLFERDCSLQRRHQKVIEEAPAPGMDPKTRAAICAAAVRAAKAVDYQGAGTIEFIADASEGLRTSQIFFMEMNTRLQVEHPVTEAITGVDLVEWQLRIASGEPLPLKQEELRINGHAIEARLYAEDPAKGFLPSTGRLAIFAIGDGDARIETGVAEGDEISPHYDPMIAKIITHAETRAEAIGRMEQCLAQQLVFPVKTNAPFLLRAVSSEAFKQARLDTGLIARHPHWAESVTPSQAACDQAARAFWHRAASDLPVKLPGFRLNAASQSKVAMMLGEAVVLGDAARPSAGLRQAEDGEWVWLNEAGETFAFRRFAARGSGQASAADGVILAPMPGKVIAVDVAEGQTVSAGQRLLVLEAMKMEHALAAPFAGRVEALAVRAGAQVQVEAVLCRVVPADE
jgi:3-methylcrotonyl-CoA carboxylase alpha subunit